LFSKKMHLSVPGFRNTINLLKYENEISNSIKIHIPEAIVNVYQNYYEILSANEISNGQARQIGREISANSELGKFVKQYKYEHSNGTTGLSGQLFVEMRI